MTKRKIYDKLLEWKQNSNGKTAILIDGARRVGKSYIVEEFAKNNYFILVFEKDSILIHKSPAKYLEKIVSLLSC